MYCPVCACLQDDDAASVLSGSGVTEEQEEDGMACPHSTACSS